MRKSFTRLLSLLALFCVLGLQTVYGVVTDRTPADNATKVSPSTDLTLTFTYPLERGDNFTGAVIELWNKDNSTRVDAVTLPSSRFVIDGNKITIDIQASLSDLTSYYVVFPNKVVKEKVADGVYTNFAGYSAVTDWDFTTGDFTGPKLASAPFNPADGAARIGGLVSSPDGVKKTDFQLTFANKPNGSPEQAKGVSGKYIKIYSAAGEIHEMKDAGQFSSFSNTFTFSTKNLRENTDYYILIDAGAFIDDADAKNEFAGISDKTKWNFSTRDYSAAVVASGYPVKSNVLNQSFDMKIKLDEPASVYYYVVTKAYAAANYASALPTSANVISRASNTIDASNANTEYSATVNSYFDGVSVAAIPPSTSSADYVVYYCTVNKSKLGNTSDGITSEVVKFDALATKDETAPLVAVYTPLNPSTGISAVLDASSPTKTFALEFDESVKAGTGSIVLKKSSDNSVVESVDINSGNVSFVDVAGVKTKKVIVKFSKKLDSNTKYYVAIASGVILDQTGNKYAGISTTTGWYFTTADTVAPVVLSFSSPASKGVLGASESIVIKFSEELYSAAGAGNGLTNLTAFAAIALEKNNAPVIPASVTYNNAEKSITVTYAWAENSTYVVKVLKNKLCDKSGNFITTEVQKSYSTDSYTKPSITDNASTPASLNGQTVFMAASDNILVRFSEPVQLLSGDAIDNSNVGGLVTLSQNGGSVVATNVTYDATKRLITIDPVSDLAANKDYTLTVGAGYQDFNLIDGPNPGPGATATYKVKDGVAPAITFDFTKTNVKTVGTELVVKFSEEVYNPSSSGLGKTSINTTYLNNYVTLREGDANGPVVPLAAAYAVSGDKTFTFSPASNLKEGTTYYLAVAANAVVDAGYKSLTSFSYNKNAAASTTFTTKTSPKLASSVPTDEATGVSKDLSKVVLTYSEAIKVNTNYLTTGAPFAANIPVVVVKKGTLTVVAYAPISSTIFSGSNLTANLTSVTPWDSEGEYEVLVDGGFILNSNNNASISVAAGDVNFKIADFIKPAITSWSYDGLNDASKLSAPLKFTFNQPIKKGSGTITLQCVSPSLLTQEVIDVNSAAVTISTDQKTISINHSEIKPSLAVRKIYKVTMTEGAITDLNGLKHLGLIQGSSYDETNVPAGYGQWTVNFGSSVPSFAGGQLYFVPALDVAPSVLVNNSTPKHLSDNVSLTTDVIVVFDKNISLMDGTKKITLRSAGGVVQEYAMNQSNVTISGKTITVKLASAGLANNTTYSVLLQDGAVKDVYGVGNSAITSDADWKFFTGNEMPPVPTLVLTGKKNDSYSLPTDPIWVEVKRTGNIVINFDEPIRKLDNSEVTSADLDHTSSIIQLSSGSGVVPARFAGDISADKKTITIDASTFASAGGVASPLTSLATYIVTIKGNQIENSNNKPIAADIPLYFTVDDYDAPVGNFVAGNDANIVENEKGTEVKVAFDFDENAKVYYQLLPVSAVTPTKASLIANGNAVLVDKDADPATSVVIPTSASTEYKLYVVAEDVVNQTIQALVQWYPIKTADIVNPTVVTYVNNGKTDVNPSADFNVKLQFADDIALGAGNAYLYNSSDVLVTTIPAASAGISGKDLTITISSAYLTPGVSYYLNVDKGFVTDLATTLPNPNTAVPATTVNKYAGFSDKTTYTFTVKDNVAPVVKASTPSNTSSPKVAADSNSNIVITFDKDIKLGSNAGVGTIEIFKPTSALQELIIANSSLVSISGKVLTINPSVDFINGALGYSVKLGAGTVASLASVDNAATTLTFDVKDVIAPTVDFRANTNTGSKLVDKAIDPTTDVIDVKFKDVLGAAKEVRLLDNSDFITDDLDSLISFVDATSKVKVKFTTTYVSKSEFKVVPVAGELKSNSTYTLSFGSVFEDKSDNAVPAQSVTFKTRITDSPVVVFDPENASENVSASKSITITFNRAIVQEDPTVTTDGYFKPVTNDVIKNYILLKSGADDVAYKASISTDKKVITIDPVIDFSSGAPISLTFDPQGIKSDGTSEGDLNSATEIPNLVDSLNNPVVVDPDYVDAVFGNNGGVVNFDVVDYIAPVLAGDKLVPNKKYLNSDAKLQLIFNEDVKGGSGDISIYRKDGTLVETIAASTLLNNSKDNKIIEINPVKARENNTEYYVIVPEGAIVDKSPLANKFAGLLDNSKWIYKTADNQSPVVSVLSPVKGSSNVGLYDNLAIYFDKDIALGSGLISIYKKDGSAYDLIRVEDKVRATIDPVDTKKLIIDFARVLEQNTEYYVTIESGAIVNKDNADAKFAGILDNSTWTFSTESTTAPKVVSLSPVDDATGVSISAPLTLKITFDADVQAGTGTVRLVNTLTGSLVESIDVSKTTISSSKREVSIPVTAALKENTLYHVFVDANAYTNTLPSKVGFAGINAYDVWNFTTAADVTAPTLTVTAPVAPIAKVFTVGLTFSEPVTGVASGVTVTNGTAVVSGSGAQYSITVTSEEQTNVTIVLANTITDLAKTPNAFAGQTLSYTTGDFTAPALVSSTPTGALTDNHPTFVVTFGENIAVGSGSLNIYKKSDGTLALSIPVTAGMISGKVATVTYTYDAAKKNGLDQNTDYYVLVDKGFVKDVAGNEFAGVTASTTWTFKTGGFVTPVEPDVNNSLEFKVYPNPFVDYVTVSNASELSKVVVSNIAGQVVKEVVYPDGTIQLNELRSGVYFITLYKDNEVVSTVKLLKR